MSDDETRPLSAAARTIFIRHWPRLVEEGVDLGLRPGTAKAFLLAMRYIQADLIRLYLPAMSQERAYWARQTLKRLPS